MRVFLPWTSHFLPQVAAHLVSECAGDPRGCRDADLSGWLLVVRGRSAGRRLLSSLAAAAAGAGRALVPPRIVTPGAMEDAIFGADPTVAGPFARRLAWTIAMIEAPPGLIAKVWAMPGNGKEASLAAISTLAAVLERTWSELGSAGVDFAGAFEQFARIAPDSADVDEERWHALQQLLDACRAILAKWKLTDPSARRARLTAAGHPVCALRIGLVGVVELAPSLVALLRTLRDEPDVFIHAPESEAGGFDEWGRLVAPYWARRCCDFSHGEIHPVLGPREQVAKCAELVRDWTVAGLSPSSVTVATPDPSVTRAVLDALADAGFPARAAEGCITAKSGVIRLLSGLADFLDGTEGAPPPYSAVARLARHPDLAPELRLRVRELDDFFNTHLPREIDRSFTRAEGRFARVGDAVTRLANLAAVRATNFADDVGALIMRVYGGRNFSTHSELDRALVHSLEAVREALDEIERLPRSAPGALPAAALLRILAEIAGASGAPSPERTDAVEICGWLEAAADDAPGLIVTSVCEGSLPEGAPVEPLLIDALREKLGLACRTSRFARDQYTLHAVSACRTGAGRIALIAPRRGADGQPVRPSRLLFGSAGGAALAKRLLGLVATPPPARLPVASGSGLIPPVPDPEKLRAHRKFRVTSFRTYLASPLLFYFKHVLALAAMDDESGELAPGMFGTTIHAVLEKFGARHLRGDCIADVRAIQRETDELLSAHMRQHFGPHALAPVRAQARAIEARLRRFAEIQAGLFAEGWEIVWVEQGGALEVPFPVPGVADDARIRGRIDRIDRHRDGRWRVIDYKSASQAVSPDRAHYSARGEKWRDLQLPLYVKLLEALPAAGGPSVDPENLDLVYFNLPPKWDDIGVSAPFDRERIPEAWEKAAEIITEVCSGTGCRDVGDVPDNEDPAFLALCGLNGLPVVGGEE